jgi:hypothetical protein
VSFPQAAAAAVVVVAAAAATWVLPMFVRGCRQSLTNLTSY